MHLLPLPAVHPALLACGCFLVLNVVLGILLHRHARQRFARPPRWQEVAVMLCLMSIFGSALLTWKVISRRPAMGYGGTQVVQQHDAVAQGQWA